MRARRWDTEEGAGACTGLPAGPNFHGASSGVEREEIQLQPPANRRNNRVQERNSVGEGGEGSEAVISLQEKPGVSEHSVTALPSQRANVAPNSVNLRRNTR